MAFSFNLVDEPWIPARTVAGELVEWSLADALLQARRARRIEDPSPLVVAAVHRLLLAVLHRALEGPENERQAVEWFQSGFPQVPIREYLDHWRRRFDLFDGKAPFYQVGDLVPEVSPLPWTVLAAELASGNNKLLFDHSLHNRPRPASPAEAARALVAHQQFTPGGLIRKLGITSVPGAPMAKAAVVITLGDTLAQTLALNMVRYPREHRGHDRAIWEEDPPVSVDLIRRDQPEGVRGLVHRYTWLSRGVRFLPEKLDGRTEVRWIAYVPGIRRNEPRGATDPMPAYRHTEKAELVPIAFRVERAFWRDYLALIPQSEDPRTIPPAVVGHGLEVHRMIQGVPRRVRPPLRVMVLGQATDRAKVELWRSEVHYLPEAIIQDPRARDEVRWALEEAEETGRSLDGAGRILAKALLSQGERRPRPEDVGLVARTLLLRTAYWSILEVEFPGFLQALTPEVFTADSSKEATRVRWLQAVSGCAHMAWQSTLRSLGTDARALRAAAHAEGVLLAHLAVLRKRIEEAGGSRQEAS